MKEFAARLFGAARLDYLTYEEVKNDPAATLQAIFLFTLILLIDLALTLLGGDALTQTAALETGVTWGQWLVHLTATYFVGTRIYVPSSIRPTYGQLLRTTVFASSPVVPLSILSWLLEWAVVPDWVAWVCAVAGGLWCLLALLLALCVVFEYESWWQAVWLFVLSSLIFGVPAALLLLAWVLFW